MRGYRWVFNGMATMHLLPDFKELLKLLNAHQVKYLLIGGYAVGYHGYPRATADMDIWVAIDPQNAEKLGAVLVEFGFAVPELSPGLFLKEVGVTQFRRKTGVFGRASPAQTPPSSHQLRKS